MALSYDDWKSQWEGMTDVQRARVSQSMKDNATFQEYGQKYVQEKTGKTINPTGYQTSTVNNTPKTTTGTSGTSNNTPVVQDTPTKQETPTVVTETKTGSTSRETPVTTVSEIKQQGELKPLSQEYYNQTSEDAQNKIINNLNTYKASNPEYFTDYETFKRNFSYDARNDEQKNTLDTWYKGYSQGLQLSSTPVTDLYTQYKNGSISTTDLESLRVSNPEKYAELQAQINKGNIIAAYDDDNTTSDTMWEQLRNTFLQNMITNLNTAGSGASNIFADYQEKMESPEMVSLGDDAASKQEEIEKVSADIDSMRKQVEEEYEGTGASRAKINAIVADRTYDLQLQLRSLNSEYNRIATQYNNRMTQYQNEFQLQLQEYQINMQERNQKMNELGFAMDLMNYETPQQKQEREWNYWVKQQEYQNGDINSKDYSTRYKAALKGVENLLSQYPGIPMERSAEQMAEDVLKAVDAGSTLGAELTNINKLIQKKPEYKKLYNASYGTGSSVIEDTFKSGNTEWVKYNGQWYTSDEFNKTFGSNNKQKAYTQVDEKVFNPISTKYQSTGYNTLGGFLDQEGNQAGKKGGQCGKFVNDYLQYIGVTDSKNRYYDDNLSTKLASVNSYTPTVGSVAVFDYNHKSSDGINHGHVGIVTKVYEDGSFDVIDSNYDTSKPNTITKRHVNAGQGSTKGFFNPSIASNATSTTSSLSEVDEAKKQNYLEEAKRGRISQTNTVQIGDLAAEQGWGDEWRDALNQGINNNLTDSQWSLKNTADNTFKGNELVKEFESSLNQIGQLKIALDDKSGVGDMSAIFTFMKTLDPSSVVRESEFNSAAATAGVLNPAAIYQKIEQRADGKFLTPQQREDFKKIAIEFVKIKANNYQTKYDELSRMYSNGNIGSKWLPTNMANKVLSELGLGSTVTQTSLGFDSSIASLQSQYSIKK